jgi:hypothetical protein
MNQTTLKRKEKNPQGLNPIGILGKFFESKEADLLHKCQVVVVMQVISTGLYI